MRVSRRNATIALDYLTRKLSAKDIAQREGLSPSRVHQIVDKVVKDAGYRRGRQQIGFGYCGFDPDYESIDVSELAYRIVAEGLRPNRWKQDTPEGFYWCEMFDRDQERSPGYADAFTFRQYMVFDDVMRYNREGPV